MPSLRDIRNRIGSVKTTRQITKAMKMVAAAKLRRAQDAILKTRPYAQLLDQALARVAARAAAEEVRRAPAARAARPAHAPRWSSSRATAASPAASTPTSPGARSASSPRTPTASSAIQLATIGRKGRDFFRARKIDVRKDYTGVHADLALREGGGDRRRVHGSASSPARWTRSSSPTTSSRAPSRRSRCVVQLLPVETPPAAEAAAGDRLQVRARRARRSSRDLLPRHVAMQVWRALLESAASRARRPHERHGDARRRTRRR